MHWMPCWLFPGWRIGREEDKGSSSPSIPEEEHKGSFFLRVVGLRPMPIVGWLIIHFNTGRYILVATPKGPSSYCLLCPFTQRHYDMTLGSLDYPTSLNYDLPQSPSETTKPEAMSGVPNSLLGINLLGSWECELMVSGEEKMLFSSLLMSCRPNLGVIFNWRKVNSFWVNEPGKVRSLVSKKTASLLIGMILEVHTRKSQTEMI